MRKECSNSNDVIDNCEGERVYERECMGGVYERSV
jgi:hypothetical protein